MHDAGMSCSAQKIKIMKYTLKVTNFVVLDRGLSDYQAE